jgi:hypothetical protein
LTPNNLSLVPIEVPPEGPPVYTLCHLPARESNALSVGMPLLDAMNELQLTRRARADATG